MKKILASICLFTIFLINSYANNSIAGNGYDGTGNQYLSNLVFPIKKDLEKEETYSKEINKNYVERALSSITCDNALFNKDDYYSRLTSLDLKSGTYGCTYYAYSAPEIPVETKKFRSSMALQENIFFSKVEKSIQDLNAVNYLPEFRDYYGNYVLKDIYGLIGKNINQVSLLNIENSIKEVIELAKENEINLSNVNYVDSTKIDSHTDHRQTLAAAFTGMITVDPDYFETGHLVNNQGEANLKDFSLINENNYAQNNLGGEEQNFIEELYTSLRDLNKTFQQVNTVTAYSFVDKYIWGFYIVLIENLRDAYEKLLYLIIAMGSVYTGGRIAFGATKDWVEVGDKNQAKENALGQIKSKVLEVVVVSVFFMIPINWNQVTLPDKFVYKEKMYTLEQQEIDTEKRQQFTQTSTIAQSSIRYFAEKGLIFGNYVSDYGFFAYLMYLQGKSAIYSVEDVEEMKRALFSLTRRSYDLYKDTMFFDSVCIPLYYNELRRGGKNDEKVISSSANSNSSLLLQEYLGVKEIDYKVCAKINSDIVANTNYNLASFQNLRKKIAKMKILLENEDDEEFNNKKIGLKESISVLSFTQTKNGWLNIVQTPTVHTFLTEKAALSDDRIEDELGDEFKSGSLVQAYYDDKDKVDELNDSVVADYLANIIMSGSAWAIMPGFFNSVFSVYNGISKLMIFQEEKKMRMDEEESKVSAVTRWTSSLIKSVVRKIPFFKAASVAEDFFSIAMTMQDYVKYLALFALCFFMVMNFYLIMISTATLIIVSAAISFKVVFYFIELLIYYLVSDIIAFFAIVNREYKYITNFLAKGVTTLMFAPSLIVISVNIYIFAVTIAKDLYNLILGQMYDILIILNTQIVSRQADAFTLTGGFLTRIEYQFKISAYKSFGEITILLFGLFFAILIILKFKDWIFQTAGINESNMGSQITDQMQQKIAGIASPIK